MASTQYLFGPVASRRMGRSLGIDLFPSKICSLDCIYCECGKTVTKTTARSEYTPTAAIIAELDAYLSSHPRLDYITFSGTGEPTLHSGIGHIIAHLKKRFSRYQVAVLTNGAMLSDYSIRLDILEADLVCPSLDGATKKSFKKINRPHNDLHLHAMIDGMISFRHEYTGQIWLEIFIVPGVNDDENELEAFKSAILRIQPDKIQLNSLDRPGSESWVNQPDKEDLIRIRDYFLPLPVEIISKTKSKTPDSIIPHETLIDRMLHILERRPSTAEDLAETFGGSINEIEQLLHILVKEQKIAVKRLTRGDFYFFEKLIFQTSWQA